MHSTTIAKMEWQWSKEAQREDITTRPEEDSQRSYLHFEAELAISWGEAAAWGDGSVRHSVWRNAGLQVKPFTLVPASLSVLQLFSLLQLPALWFTSMFSSTLPIKSCHLRSTALSQALSYPDNFNHLQNLSHSHPRPTLPGISSVLSLWW